MSCLKERIQKGVTLPMKAGELDEKNGNCYQRVKERSRLNTTKGIFILDISFKQYLSEQTIWDVKLLKLRLYNEDFLTIKLRSAVKQEISCLMKENTKIDRHLKTSF